VTDHGDGTYTATFTGTIAGRVTITATIDGQADTYPAPALMILPGPLSLAQSNVTLSAATVTSGSGRLTVTLTAPDAPGGEEMSGGLVLAFGLGSGRARRSSSPVTDHGDGTYTATFTGTTAGSLTITATIGGQSVSSAAPSVTVTPGTVSLAQSRDPQSAATGTSGAGRLTGTLTAPDASGGQQMSGGRVLAFGRGSGSGRGMSSAVTDHGDGTYTATFTGTTAGSLTITATIGGQSVSSAAPSVTVTPGTVSLAQS